MGDERRAKSQAAAGNASIRNPQCSNAVIYLPGWDLSQPVFSVYDAPEPPPSEHRQTFPGRKLPNACIFSPG